jgi:hypothetical protein
MRAACASPCFPVIADTVRQLAKKRGVGCPAARGAHLKLSTMCFQPPNNGTCHKRYQAFTNGSLLQLNPSTSGSLSNASIQNICADPCLRMYIGNATAVSQMAQQARAQGLVPSGNGSERQNARALDDQLIAGAQAFGANLQSFCSRDSDNGFCALKLAPAMQSFVQANQQKQKQGGGASGPNGPNGASGPSGAGPSGQGEFMIEKLNGQCCELN